MQYRRLGRTDLQVSAVCLGTMTWGEQNDAAEAHAQLDLAVDRGVNFIDTAELYPIPPRGETCGRTESIIGDWLARRGNRERIVLASKVCGPTDWCPHIRNGISHLDRANIRAACEASLTRLRTDHLDLYQVHWPERNTNYFGKLGYAPEEDADATPIEETLAALDELVREGKVRFVGISNETPWGAHRYLRAAEEDGGPRIVSIQNPYNLLNRSFEVGLAEFAHREGTGLLAYSPLGFGTLTGKYLGGAAPEGARLTLFPHYGRYTGETGVRATEAYVALAREHGLDPAQMALAFIHGRPFTTAVIVGATSVAQLERNLDGAGLTLPEEVVAGIERIHAAHPNPCP